jgi:SH3-like domain-containing protein
MAGESGRGSPTCWMPAALTTLLLLGVLAGYPARADFVSGLDPNGDNYLSFRSGPGGRPYVELDRLGPNTPVTVLRRDGAWYQIRLRDGRTGWAFGRYIHPGSPPTAASDAGSTGVPVYVSGLDPNGDNYLSFRTGPGGRPYAELDRLGPNTPAWVIGESGKWWKIRLRDGRVGWAHSAYLAPGSRNDWAVSGAPAAPTRPAAPPPVQQDAFSIPVSEAQQRTGVPSGGAGGALPSQPVRSEPSQAEVSRPLKPPVSVEPLKDASANPLGEKPGRSETAVAGGRRFALVIGIDAYESVPPLQKAVNDARAMTSVLRELGFEVTSGENLGRAGLSRKLIEFESGLRPGDTALFFFAGHGFEIRGQNFLLPADVPAVFEGQEELIKDSAFAADRIIDRIRERGARTVVAVLDACRNNPFERPGGRSVPGTRGLAQMTPAEGVFVVFSAGAKQEAIDRLSDDDQNPNSVFTRVFRKQLATPGLALDQMVKRTRLEVRELARTIGREQTPAYYDQIVGEVVLKPAE